MKPSSNSVVLLLLFLSILSCHNNNLKTDEKDLAREILNEKKVKTESNNSDLKLSEAGKEGTVAFRKREIRKADPENPPIKLYISSTKNDTRHLKLSDIASSIRYIKLETPPDTALLYDPSFAHNDLHSYIRSDGNHIIFQGLFGLTRFNMMGEYQETIWKNETGIKFLGSGVGYGGQDFFGVMPNTPVSIQNGILYYSFQDGPGGNSNAMKYKPGIKKNISLKSNDEITGLLNMPGDTLLNSNQIFPSGFDYIFGTGINTWAGVNQKWNSGKSGALLVTYNDKGDTLCVFKDYDRIINFSKPNYRNPEKLSCYYFNGLLTFKQEYNDTVFRLIPPDRILPTFIIEFGDSKVNYMDGLNPDFDLSGKYFLNTIQESNDFLFICYIQYYTPASKKGKAIKYYYSLFDKKEDKLNNLPGFTLEPAGINNDLNGGIPFWPDFITPQGEMMKLVSGKVIKDYISSDEFKKSGMTAENRLKQISIASGLKPTDMVIVIAK
jgi:hypothetical protein